MEFYSPIKTLTVLSIINCSNFNLPKLPGLEELSIANCTDVDINLLDEDTIKKIYITDTNIKDGPSFNLSKMTALKEFTIVDTNIKLDFKQIFEKVQAHAEAQAPAPAQADAQKVSPISFSFSQQKEFIDETLIFKEIDGFKKKPISLKLRLIGEGLENIFKYLIGLEQTDYPGLDVRFYSN